MKSWKQISEEYSEFLSENIKNHQPRISALIKIEKYIQEQYPDIINKNIEFNGIPISELKDNYQVWKGKDLNGAEEQVFNDFYNLT